MVHPNCFLRKVEFDLGRATGSTVLQTIATWERCNIRELKLHYEDESNVSELNQFLNDMIQTGRKMDLLHLSSLQEMDGFDFVDSCRGRPPLKILNATASKFELVVAVPDLSGRCNVGEMLTKYNEEIFITKRFRKPNIKVVTYYEYRSGSCFNKSNKA